ncbi:MAG TPA: hypothetical protein VN420_02120 [Candidatus Fimivivens sp.]|nr:hypothetical protein [Candidatus Fimivivens sp.]
MIIHFVEKKRITKKLADASPGTLFRFADDTFHSVLEDDAPPLYIVLQRNDDGRILIVPADMKSGPLSRDGNREIVTYQYEWRSETSFMKKVSYLKDSPAGNGFAISFTEGLDVASAEQAEAIDKGRNSYLILPMKAPDGQVSLWSGSVITFHDGDQVVVQRPTQFSITVDTDPKP